MSCSIWARFVTQPAAPKTRRQGEKETRRKKRTLFSLSPCLPVSLFVLNSECISCPPFNGNRDYFLISSARGFADLEGFYDERSRTRFSRASLTSGGRNLSSRPPNVAIWRSNVLLTCEYASLAIR